MKSYSDPTNLDGSHEFVPFVINEFGRITARGDALLETMAERITAAWREGSAVDRQTGAARLARRWRARISCAVASMLSRSALSFARAARGINKHFCVLATRSLRARGS